MADATESSASHCASVPDSSAAAPIERSQIDPALALFPDTDREDIATDTSVTASDEVSQVPRMVVLALVTNASAKAVDLQRYRFGSVQRFVCGPVNSRHLCRLSHIGSDQLRSPMPHCQQRHRNTFLKTAGDIMDTRKGVRRI